jgi:hypothetical protein
MNIQADIESAIYNLVDDFLYEAYDFFTEADAVVRFQKYLAEFDSLSKKVVTNDGHEVSLIHREYPTFFRFSGKNPTKRLDAPARRGHYDTVILDPDFVRVHSSESVANRNIYSERDESITPFLAVIEFKFHDFGWAINRVNSVLSDFGKLKLSCKEAPLRYLVTLTRYRSPTLNRWDTHWPTVKNTADDYQEEINSIFAVNWVNGIDKPEEYVFGEWLVERKNGS